MPPGRLPTAAVDAQRGAALLSALIDITLVLGLFMVVANAALWFHGVQRAHRAAWEAAQEASLADSSFAAAEAIGLQELGRSVVHDAAVVVAFDRGEPGVVVATVSGRSQGWIPIRAVARVEVEPRLAQGGP